MKSLIQERGGKFCSKRFLAILFGISGIIATFVGIDASIVIALISASIGSNTLTLSKIE